MFVSVGLCVCTGDESEDDVNCPALSRSFTLFIWDSLSLNLQLGRSLASTNGPSAASTSSAGVIGECGHVTFYTDAGDLNSVPHAYLCLKCSFWPAEELADSCYYWLFLRTPRNTLILTPSLFSVTCIFNSWRITLFFHEWTYLTAMHFNFRDAHAKWGCMSQLVSSFTCKSPVIPGTVSVPVSFLGAIHG